MAKISFYDSLPAKNQKHFSSSNIEMVDFLNDVKYGKWKELVLNIRKEKDKSKRDAIKRGLPSITISGVFHQRLAADLIQHSGFICIDIDGFNDKSALITDPYTYALFQSVSALGIALIVKINPEQHAESFKWLQNYYFVKYGLTIDPAPSSVASLRFVSYDPDLIINEKSRLSKTIVKKQKKYNSIPVVCSDDLVGQMIQECCSLGHNIAPDYESYLRLGFALANGFGEQGRNWFHSLSQISEKYNSNQADKQYDHCLRGAHKSGVSVGTLYWMLKNVGIHIPKQDQKPIHIASLGKKSGRSQQAVIEQLTEINKIEPRAAKKIVEEVFKRDDISLKTLASDPEQLIESLVEWTKQNHPIRKNALTGKYEESGTEIKRERLNYIYLRARSVFNTPNVNYDLIERIIFSEFTPTFNPFDEYLAKNAHRNTSGNIDTLCRSIQSDTPMFEVFIRKWCLSWFAALDGHPVRLVLALVGSQRSGKTEWFRRLLPTPLKPYYGESKLLAGKDDEILMCQKLILMDDEMGGKSTSDEKRFKELTSKSTFSLRAPYARANEDFKRLAVLCGTSNEDQIINDLTGNTRILPVHVISIDHELYNSINKDELFMELYRSYQASDDWMLTNDEFVHLNDTGKEFEATPIERELILKYFSNEPPEDYQEKAAERLTATEIKDIIESNSKQKIMSMKRFGTELKSIFGKSTPKKVSGKTMFRYDVYVLKSILNPVNYANTQEYEEPF